MKWLARHRVLAALLLVLVTIVTLGASSHIMQPPGIPYTPWGYVRYDGILIGAGASVTAWIDGVQFGADTTSASSLYTFDIPQDDPGTPAKDGGAPGDVVTFQVNGMVAPQTDTWRAGAFQVDLALSSATATPTATPCTQRIYGYVFDDLNGNGYRDAGETTGLSGVMVYTALKPGGMNMSVQTGSVGWYQVYHLDMGEYEVTMDTPAGYVLTSPPMVNTTLDQCSWNYVYFGVWPVTTATVTSTATPTVTATASPTVTGTIIGPTSSPTLTATPTPTATKSPTLTATVTSTATPTPTATPRRSFFGLILKGVTFY
jgi:hypothetical protein